MPSLGRPYVKVVNTATDPVKTDQEGSATEAAQVQSLAVLQSLLTLAQAAGLRVVFPSAQAVTQSGTWTVGISSLPAITGTVAVSTLPAITFASPQAVTQSGTWTVQPGNTPNTAPWLISPRAQVGSGLSRLRLTAAASTNATSIKAAPGILYTVHGYNAAAALRYLKLYDLASAPTVGTTTPVEVYPLLASSPFRLDFGPYGAAFATGIGLGLTTGLPDADTGALTAGDVILTAHYL